MKFKKGRIFILSGSLALMLVFLIFTSELSGQGMIQTRTDSAFYFSVNTEDTSLNILPSLPGDDYYLFLPSSYDPEAVTFHSGYSGDILLNGRPAADGSPVSLITGGENEIVFCDSSEAATGKITLQVMVSENLPAIFIDTASGDMENIHSDKSCSEKGFLRAVDSTGKLLVASQIEELGGRGNTSWDVPKKCYNLHTNSAMEFPEITPGKDWILSANYYDGSYLRNELGYRLAAHAGLPYTPESFFADLYLNGEYAGLYQFTPKNNSHHSRLETENQFLAELDYPGRAALEPDKFFLENKQAVVLHSLQDLGQEEINSIQNYFFEWMAALYSPDYKNPSTGKDIFEYIDIKSFSRMYLLEEIFEDLDMGVTSHFFYRQLERDGGLLVDSPVWDLDNTMGRGTDSLAAWTEIYAADHNLSSNNLSRWYARLCGNDAFFEQMTGVWRNIYSPFLKELTQEGIDRRLSVLLPSIRMDQARWPGVHSQFTAEMDLEDNIAFLKEYLKVRTEYLDDILITYKEQARQWYLDNASGLPALVPGAYE